MKNVILLFVFLCASIVLSAQNTSLAQLAIIDQNGNWIEMLPEARVEPHEFFGKFLIDLGLDADYSFELQDMSTDGLGLTHYRYQEQFKGNPIEGGTYMLHVKNGFVSHANGKLIRGILDNGSATVSAEEALDIAKAHMDSDVFYWEMPEMEARIKHAKNDLEATFRPEPELVLAQPQYSQQGESYRLAWKYDIHAAYPDQKKTVFVDAGSAEVMFELEGCHHGSVEGVAETRYHGTQTIITDSISPSEYRLIDATRGGGIETFDLNEEDNDYSSAVDFVDEDNVWDNANAELDDAATDAHWGAEMFYDYFLGTHGRDSYDGNGSMLVTYVHYGDGVFNAFWNGSFATFGDGSDNPLTSIDVVGHEYAHGVTGTSAGLIYQDESGALNESFSDIFGTAIEFFALGDSAEWLLGKENFVLRDISNPNDFGDPDTYGGTSWVTGPGDNGGVHTNSGVQNFWFYLLTNGGTGTNDNGDEYAVDSLGMEKAAAIAYRNLTVYLTESSDYLDARLGSILSAEDLYGTCSDEVLAVAQAWHAVGLGPATITPDFQVLEVLSPLYSSCDLGSEEQVSMQFRFNPSGCGLSLDAGDEIEVSYQIGSQTPIVETIVLTAMINDGDLITHEFQTLADLSEPDIYLLDYTVDYLEDLTPGNNEISNYKLTNPFHISDGSILAFDHFNAKDSIYAVLGAHAEGAIKLNEGFDDSKGFRMNGFGATPENVNIVESEDENYAANPDFTSKLCTCIDLPDWDEAYLNFDLRQTFSDLYLDDLGLDIDYMIALRVLVDEQQIGAQFHPETNYADPYEHHVMDVSAYAGTSFSLCFEAVNFVNAEEDGNEEGDKSTLDNIFFSPSEATGLDDLQLSTVDVYPNPSSGLLTIALDEPGTYDLEVVDVLGHVVRAERLTSNGSAVHLDLTELAKGTYVLSMRSEEFNAIQKVLIE